jgi:CRISPR-associated endonuclease/helicase Cas3
MGTDIKILKSHPNKLLLTHIEGVRSNTKKLTDSRIAELVAIFHDLGKINPNFQAKLNQKACNGYSNHSYLSAYIFFCAFCGTKQGRDFLSDEKLSVNDIIALIVLIAKHHGNIPDFVPEDNDGCGATILSKDENDTLFHFVDKERNIPVLEYVNHYFPKIEDFNALLTDGNVQDKYSNKLIFNIDKNTNALDFFLDTQFTFASVIQADKADAGETGNIIDAQLFDVQEFSKKFAIQLDLYLAKLNQDTEFNKLRTIIRNHAVKNIQKALVADECVFELTAPTGSGKTLMLLSLASEIVKAKGAKRIIYALPFLSITEQVESEIIKIFANQTDYIQRVDSKSENIRFDKIQNELDKEITEEKLHELNALEFQENTFAYPLVITTFVRFFETLLSNRNSELLKLPNFSNCIFLIDEIQALPPRLYGFFVAYITKFCRKFNSYAVISTATQPNFKLPDNNINAKNFFSDYKCPKSLLPLSYFDNDMFNRYKIVYNQSNIDIDTLKEQIIGENSSVLVILNTINDTRELYIRLKENCCSDDVLLLNTHFTPYDRKLKIDIAKQRLKEKQRIIIVSTQLIEAGVDIDFPVLYRDFATVASIVQSAGRCNRNGKLPNLGKVVLFKLERNGKVRSEIIYRGKDKDILTFTKQAISNNFYKEKELLQVQQDFFNRIQSELNFACHSQNSPKIEFDFLKDIKECAFDKIGKFQLIDKQEFGEEMQYYIPTDSNDPNFETLKSFETELIKLLKQKAEMSLIKQQKNKIKYHLKKMSNQIVQVRLKKEQNKPGVEDSYFDLHKIDLHYYSFEKGIDLQGGECII